MSAFSVYNDRRRRGATHLVPQSWEGPVAETAKQITVFLENKPGRLANVLSELARQKVNITALTVMDRHEHGVLRLVTDNAARTIQVIAGLNAPHTETE